MSRYVDYLVASSNGLIRGGGDYGDWLNLEDPTPGDLIGTSFIAKGARQLSQMASAIGNTADAAKYQKVYEDVRSAFAARFVAADGKVGSDSQTGYILAFTSDLVPPDLVDEAGRYFANTILRRDTHLSTGFLGVDGLLPVLTKIGRSDLAYQLLQNTSYPSWGYEIGKGATTIWERWNSINPDGTFNDVGMNSFNHYAYGAVGEWMYRTLAGVSAAEPGYRKSLIAPTPGNGITSAEFRHETPYGEVASKWKLTDGAAGARGEGACQHHRDCATPGRQSDADHRERTPAVQGRSRQRRRRRGRDGRDDGCFRHLSVRGRTAADRPVRGGGNTRGRRARYCDVGGRGGPESLGRTGDRAVRGDRARGLGRASIGPDHACSWRRRRRSARRSSYRWRAMRRRSS